jgi:hypothetical protein
MGEFKECELAQMLYDHIYRARRADSPHIAARILYEAEEKRTDYLIQQKNSKKKKHKG